MERADDLAALSQLDLASRTAYLKSNFRFSSERGAGHFDPFAERLMAALRQQFRGHSVKALTDDRS